MSYSFKFFNPYFKEVKPPTVALKKSSIIIAVPSYALMGNPEKVVIGYDEKSNTLAIQPVTEHEYYLEVHSYKSGNIVNVGKCFQTLGVDIIKILGSSKSRTLDVEWDSDLNMLLVKLPE